MPITPRERVLTSLQHKEPDRVPLALGGGPYGIVDEVYFKLVEMFDLGEPVDPFRQGHSISYMDDRILEKLGTDFRYVYPNLLPNSPVSPGEDKNSYTDSYGQIWHRATPYYYAGNGILSQIEASEDALNSLAFPDSSDQKWMKGVNERAKMLHDTTNYFISMRMVASHGPFQTACDLRGTEQFLMDMALQPEFAKVLLDKIGVFQNGLYTQAMEAGAEFFDMIELPGDDYGSNVGTIISPRMFRDFIKPILSKYVETIRAFKPEISIMFHSDGIITPLLEDLVEIGIDVIHPLEPLKGTDFVEIKKRFGEKLSFLGAIDITHALPGSKQEVLQEVRARIHQLGLGGGYILAPSNHIQADVPPENIQLLYQAAKEFGTYPINDPV